MILVFGLICVVTGTLTVMNIYNCFSKKPKMEKLIPCLTIFIGGFLYVSLYTLAFEEAGDWYESVNTIQLHYSIASQYSGIFGLIVALGAVGYFILLFAKADKLPPFISVLSIAFLVLFNVLQIAFAFQISNRVNGYRMFLYVYHLNILILSARAIQRHMLQQVEIFNERMNEKENNPDFYKFLIKIDSLSQYTGLVFVALFFVIAVIEIIFVIRGQGLDAPIKAFTDTADWRFSQQIPPPPYEYDGHYLCTVAAGGHKRIVKPIRFGTRRGETIVVNRQLCIANAFEEVIAEKFPLFHKKIRHAYDTYGYPVSRLITNAYKADVVYFIMKPLEWIFLIFLYLVDLRPEQRISNQYAFKGGK